MSDSPGMITCAHCGREVAQNRWVCPHCGAYLHLTAGRASPQTEASTGSLSISIQRPRPGEDEPRRWRLSLFSLLIIVLGLAVFALLAVVVGRGYFSGQSGRSAPIATMVVVPTEPGESAALVRKQTTRQPIPLATYPSLLAEVKMTPLAGEGLVRLTKSPRRDYSPCLSRDQAHLIYSTEIDGRWQIVEADPNGAGVIRQITSGEANYYTPSFSLSGEEILVVSDIGVNLDIYLISFASGKILKQLTTDPANDYAPRWLADYSGFVFTSQRDGNDEVYLMLLEGDKASPTPYRLTDNPAFDGYPAVSTSGEMIAFYSDRDETYNYEIYLMPLAAPMPRRLTDNPARDAMPVFSPGDAWIVFESNRETNYEIYALRVDDEDESTLRNLSNDAANDYMPVFSPDGLWLLFQSERSGMMDIYRLPWP